MYEMAPENVDSVGNAVITYKCFELICFSNNNSSKSNNSKNNSYIKIAVTVVFVFA